VLQKARSAANTVISNTSIQKLANLYPWFSTCVRDVRMLRIEENNDLKPAIGI